ncbi:MAG: class I SAM-dependent methyltransferase [Candidatus Ranarchaeia archaeon]
MEKEHLQKYYSQHHKDKKRLGFIYGGVERARLFAGWVGKGKRVLDIGCRDGALTSYYVAGNTVVGVDIDKEALKICEERLGIKTLWLDINQGLPFEPSSFDVVVAGEVLEHVFYPELVLEEIYRVLSSGGLFIGSVPSAFRLKNRLLFLLGIEYETDKTHLHQFSFKGLENLLKRYFVHVQIIPISSRFICLSPKLFGNDLVWRCQK